MSSPKKRKSQSTNRSREESQSDSSIGLQEKASQSTKNVFSQMLTRKSIPPAETTSTSKTQASTSKASTSKASTSKASTSKARPIPSRRKSTDNSAPIVIEDTELAEQTAGDYNDDDDRDTVPVMPAGKEFSPLQTIQKSTPSQGDDNRLLTVEEFNYTLSLVDNKINVLYKMCRFIADQQHETSKTLKKLVGVDELSDGFWNRAYKEIAKQLIPTILFPADKEYQTAVENYLSKNASHYINDLGRNNWLSKFNEKILPEIKAKCRSKRNDIAAHIRNAMFSAFGENQLVRVDSTTPALKLSEWKTSDKTRAAYEEIFTNSDLLSNIGYSVFKQYKGESLPTMHCAYILSICDILLNPRSSGIKCNDKSVIRRVSAFLQAFENKEAATPEMMVKIAEEEEREAREAKQKKQFGSQEIFHTGGSDVTMGGVTDEDYDKDNEDNDYNDYDSFINEIDHSQFSKGIFEKS